MSSMGYGNPIALASKPALDDVLKTGLGFTTWNFPPQLGINNGPLSSGNVWAMACPIRAGQTISSFDLQFVTAAAGTAPTGAFIGIADSVSGSTATMRAQTGNVASDAAWTAGVGLRTIALGSTYTASATGLIYVLILVNGTWGTTQPAITEGISAASFGGGVTSPIWGTTASGATALAANAANVTVTANGSRSFWVGAH